MNGRYLASGLTSSIYFYGCVTKGLDCFQPAIKVWKGLTPLCISILDPMRVSNLPRWTCCSRKTCQASRSRRCPIKIQVESSHDFLFFVVILVTFLDSFDISWTWILDDFGQSSMPKGLKWSFLGNTGGQDHHSWMTSSRIWRRNRQAS